MKYITIILSYILLFSNTFIHGQDVHFSQFYNAAMLMNPANTAKCEGDWRMVNNYRTQWRSISIPYNTLGAGFEMKIYPFNQDCGVGAYLLNDRSGALGLNVNKIFLSGSIEKVFHDNIIRFGFQPGLVYRLYDNSNMTLPSQFNEDPDVGGFFDNSLPGGEYGLGERDIYVTINSGIMWSRYIRNMIPVIGLSFNNLNRPRDSFQKNIHDYHIPLKQMLYASLSTQLTERWIIQPMGLMTRQKRANETMLGINGKYIYRPSFTKQVGFNAGAYWRKTEWLRSDAAVFAMGVDINRIHGEISYDVNVSGLKQVSAYRGAFEISLIINGINTISSKYTIPCDRF